MKLRSLVAFLLLACASPCVADVEDNILAARAMTAAIDARDLEALSRYVAEDVVRHSASTPGVDVRSLDDFRAFLAQDFAVAPDATQHIEIIFGAGDLVAVRAIYRGTQTGAMGPFPASGKAMEVPYIGILRFERGKIVEMWVEWDNLNALSQLGHFPPAQE